MRNLIAALFLSVAAPALAQSQADGLASKLWQDLSQSSNFHALDNGGAGYYLDVVKRHPQSLGGINSTLYEPSLYHMSIDINVAGYQSGAVWTGFAFPSVSYHFGELLGVQRLESKFLHQEKPQFNVGLWGARDWNAGVWRAGIYSNLSYFWGS